MTTITSIGLDLAKKVFQVHGVDSEGSRDLAGPQAELGQHYEYGVVPPPSGA